MTATRDAPASGEGFDPGAAQARELRIPAWRWSLWLAALGVAMVLFYIVLTPIWLSLRWAAWVAEFRARRRKPG